jgi:hypothetical protein
MGPRPPGAVKAFEAPAENFWIPALRAGTSEKRKESSGIYPPGIFDNRQGN